MLLVAYKGISCHRSSQKYDVFILPLALGDSIIIPATIIMYI